MIAWACTPRSSDEQSRLLWRLEPHHVSGAASVRSSPCPDTSAGVRAPRPCRSGHDAAHHGHPYECDAALHRRRAGPALWCVAHVRLPPRGMSDARASPSPVWSFPGEAIPVPDAYSGSCMGPCAKRFGVLEAKRTCVSCELLARSMPTVLRRLTPTAMPRRRALLLGLRTASGRLRRRPVSAPPCCPPDSELTARHSFCQSCASVLALLPTHRP